MSKNIPPTLIAGILSLLLAGCAYDSSVGIDKLGGGYQEVTYTRSFFSEPQAHQTSLQYRERNGRWLVGRQVMIWPSVGRVVVKNEVAVFVANKAYDLPYSREPSATGGRLFAVRAPDPPLDITDEFLWRWARQSDGELAALLKNPDLFKQVHIFFMGETNSVLEFYTEILKVGHGVTRLDVNTIPDIMREVKEKGVVRKDRVWHTIYIEKAFQPEEQK